MKNYHMILTEKQRKYQQGKISKYEYLTGAEIRIKEIVIIRNTGQSRMIEQVKFIYSALGKT